MLLMNLHIAYKLNNAMFVEKNPAQLPFSLTIYILEMPFLLGKAFSRKMALENHLNCYHCRDLLEDMHLTLYFTVWIALNFIHMFIS